MAWNTDSSKKLISAQLTLGRFGGHFVIVSPSSWPPFDGTAPVSRDPQVSEEKRQTGREKERVF